MRSTIDSKQVPLLQELYNKTGIEGNNRGKVGGSLQLPSIEPSLRQSRGATLSGRPRLEGDHHGPVQGLEDALLLLEERVNIRPRREQVR